MNILSILIICGFIYLLFVTWMFGKKGIGNQKPEATSTETKPSENVTNVKEQVNKPTPKVEVPLVPKSDFNMEDFQKAMTESMKAAMIYVLNAKVGADVTPDQVEFKDKDEAPAKNNSDSEEATETATSIDDVEPGDVSPPASGDSLEDIEAALSVAANAAKATADEKATAGNVLSGMRDVVFIGKIMSSNEKINEGVMACIAESFHRQQNSRKRGSAAPKKKSKPIDVGGTLRDIDMIKRKKDEED